MNIGEIIRTRRQELGLTLENIGDYVGVGKSTVRKWEPCWSREKYCTKMGKRNDCQYEAR